MLDDIEITEEIIEVRIGIVGSRKYTNKRKVKDFIFDLKQKLGDKLVIVSGGQKTGADGYAKKYALEFDVKYQEYPPSHYSHNMHCVLPPQMYGKKYYVSNYFQRNKLIAENSDYVIAFIPKGHTSNGTNNTIKYAEKFDKKVIIID